jgi:hypothetical protein
VSPVSSAANTAVEGVGANDGDRVASTTSYGKMWWSGEGEERNNRWDPHVSE